MSNSPEKNFPPPQEATGEEEKARKETEEKIGKYKEKVENAFSNLDSIELTEDRAVEIKLKDEEGPTIYKSPKEMLATGSLEAYPDNLVDKFPGVKAPFVFSHFCDDKRHSHKFNDVITPDSLDDVRKDVRIANITAAQAVHPLLLDAFAGLGRGEGTPIQRDKIFKGIPDEEIADGIRKIALFQDPIVHSTSRSHLSYRFGEEEIAYFEKLLKEDPEFMNEFTDFAVRGCLTSSDKWGFGLFELLRLFPALRKNLAQDHTLYSLPVIFERDCGFRVSQTNDKENMAREYRQVFEDIGLDLKKVQETLKELGSDRQYCPEIFGEQGSN